MIVHDAINPVFHMLHTTAICNALIITVVYDTYRKDKLFKVRELSTKSLGILLLLLCQGEHFQDLGNSFSLYRPSDRPGQIIYTCMFLFPRITPDQHRH